MAEEIVKDEGLVGIVKQFAENAVKTAETTEQLKSAPFVDAAMSLTNVIYDMACTLARTVPSEGQTYSYTTKYYDSMSDSCKNCYGNISAYPREVLIHISNIIVYINTKNSTIDIARGFWFRKPATFFSRLETKFMNGNKSATCIFEEYSLLPQRLSEFAKQVHDEAEKRKALIAKAMQARELPEFETKMEDPLEEKFRLLEAGESK
ncbi:MAG: hypothetical protein WC852_05180 [Candidatus Nanoarchaeia archaeon]